MTKYYVLLTHNSFSFNCIGTYKYEILLIVFKLTVLVNEVIVKHRSASKTF